MMTQPIQMFLENLALRRKALGMPWDALVERSGASRATVFRLLRDRQTTASFQTVIAVANALGVRIRFVGDAIQSQPLDVNALIDQQAEQQARKLVSLVQGTMGLESQALPEKSVTPLIKKMKKKLLSGAKKNLWYD